jgi:hypothetical protein
MSDILDSDVGKFANFVDPSQPAYMIFQGPSKLENVGFPNKNDCMLQNKTSVLILSDPVEVNHPKHGSIKVSMVLPQSKTMENKILWVATAGLKDIRE